MPVRGAQVPSHHGALGGLLDGDAVFRRRNPVAVAVSPLANLRVERNANQGAQLGYGHGLRAGEVLFEIHAREPIANATDAQAVRAAWAVANACGPVGTISGVDIDREQEHRRQRLEALLEHADFAGNKAALGRALGLTSGAYVRQLVAGERPVTEKLVSKIEAMHGGRYRGWFARRSAAAQPSAEELAHLAQIRALSEPARQMLAAYIVKLRAMDAAGEDEAPLFARAVGSSRKRQMAG